MNNPNPFLPQGSLLDQQNKRRKHMKFGVLCVLSVSVAGLMIMLIQGCKQKTDTTTADNTPPTLPPEPTNVPGIDTNPPVVAPANLLPPPPTNPVGVAPVATNPVSLPPQTPVAGPLPTVAPQSVPMPPAAPIAGSQYTVVKGDIPEKIAKKCGVTVKALLAANPGLKPNKLKIGQVITIPEGGKTSTEAPTAAAAEPTSATKSYTVKSGDTLTKIAKAHHVTVKALMAANHLTTTHILVGKSLTIPTKAVAVAHATEDTNVPVAADAAPTVPPTPAPVPLPPASSNPPSH